VEISTPQEAELLKQLSLLANLAHPRLLIGCRKIRVRDEFALDAAEAAAMAASIDPVRRASGAARIVARNLLARLGSTSKVVLRNTKGAPQWPIGFVGSIAHDSEFAVAAVATASSLASVGIDIEPILPLPKQLLNMVATPSEQNQLCGDLIAARLLFCIKEAVYKATHPRDGLFLEHHDVEVQMEGMVARTRSGHCLQIYVSRRPRLVALTTLPVRTQEDMRRVE